MEKLCHLGGAAMLLRITNLHTHTHRERERERETQRGARSRQPRDVLSFLKLGSICV